MSIEFLERYPGIGGRSLRILLAALLAWVVLPEYMYSAPGANYLLFAYSVGLLFLYLLIHFYLSYFARPMKKWVGYLIAAVPIVSFYLFGGHAGEIGALTFLGLSLFIAGLRTDTGCEVMVIPSLVLKKKSALPLLLLSPLDALEKKLSQ